MESQDQFNNKTSDDWMKNKLPKLISGYEKEDIYNCDELGLFYRLKPSQTYTLLKNSCKGGKKCKERITILACVNSNGSDKKKL